MNIHKTQFANCIKAIIIISLGMATNVQAQNVVSASVGSNSINTPCVGPLQGNITSLNVDMVEIDANTSNTRCAWGTGSDTYLWAAGYSGINQTGACVSMNTSGITVGHTTLGQTTVPLPAPWSGIANNTINYIDVAVGKHYNYSWSHDEYFVIAVYESGGNIYLEHYYIDIATSFSMMASYISLACPPTICWLSNNPLQITSNNSSSRPHIDLIYDKTYPTTGLSHDAIGYVITWQEGNNTNAQIWGADGPLTDITGVGYTPRPPFNPPFPIDDGQMPDVAGVNAAQMAAGIDPDKAYVAYLNRNGDEVHLSEWDFNSGPSYTITNHGAISATTTGQFYYPRISGPQYYDFPPSSVTNDPVCVVAATENDGSSNDKINTYAYFVTSGTNPVPVVNASDYNSFGFGSYNAMKPSITGVGSIVSSLYAGATAAYTDYPTAFYADYDNNNTTWTTSGDMYAMGTDVAQTSSAVVNLQGNNYSEVNGSELEISGYHSLAPGNEPHVAIATTNNSGYNMISAWFGGDLLYFALNNGAMPYQFKPARPSAISNTGNKNFAVYPNPVTDELNVTNAAGSEYIILDITGRKLSSGIINDADDAINVSQYANGVYMLELSKDNKTEKLKFVKQ